MGALLGMVLLFGHAAAFSVESSAGREAYKLGEYGQALSHFRVLAERGDAEAQLYLGLMYRGGEGVQVDYEKAILWYRRAAEQGHARAQTNLAISYILGRGIQRDTKKALHWLLRAARQGYTDAQVRLGELYADGRDITPDPVRAYAWYTMALLDETTCDCMQAYRDDIATRMSASDIRRAESLVEQWTQKK